MKIKNMKTITVILIFSFHCCMSITIQENEEQVCSRETFRPRCSYSQSIIITNARYGHIEISRCLETDLGYLGCSADVTHILSRTCDQKPRCEVSVHDIETAATKPCLSGLVMYLDVQYVCIPETVPLLSCSTVEVTKRLQYITSSQLNELNCNQRHGDTSSTMSFTTMKNFNIKLTITKLSGVNRDNNTSLGFISGSTQDNDIVMDTEQKEIELTSESNDVELSIQNEGPLLLVAFQAFGCEDPSVPAYTWMTRNGNQATAGCENNDYTWQLSCKGTRWFGGMGNCTSAPKEVVLTSVERKEKPPSPSNKKKETWSKEILFTLVIGITLFLCVVVVTIGYVCLKKAKYTVKATNKNNIELAGIVCDGEDTNSWSRKTFLRNGQQPSVNNQQWQQSLPKTQIIQTNGTLPANTQKYFILDRDD